MRAAETHRAMVVAENALAASAGVEILNHGGNAIDAAAATALAVGVTNPASCGIGGGGFMLIYLARTHAFYALDYRERAPMAASATMYMRNGKTDEDLARSGPLAVAVPGEIAGLDAALRRFGTMKFSARRDAGDQTRRAGLPGDPAPGRGDRPCHGANSRRPGAEGDLPHARGRAAQAR